MLDRLKTIFSNKWSYKLDSLPRCSVRNSSKVSKVPCLLSFLKLPTPQVPWPNMATSFANCLFCLPISQLKYLWAAQLERVVSRPPGQMGLGESLPVCRAVTQLLAWVWANPALGLAKLLFEDLIQADLHSSGFPGQSVSQLGPADAQSCWVGSLFGHCWCELCLLRSVC